MINNCVLLFGNGVVVGPDPMFYHALRALKLNGVMVHTGLSRSEGPGRVHGVQVTPLAPRGSGAPLGGTATNNSEPNELIRGLLATQVTLMATIDKLTKELEATRLQHKRPQPLAAPRPAQRPSGPATQQPQRTLRAES